jgi:RNA polymerase sigma-70 factor (ECF subfamily)
MANKKQSTLEALYIEYKDHLYNYIYRLCNNAELAQDVVQQTFLKLMHDPNLASLTHPKAYLFTVARNALYDQWKKKREVLLSEGEQEDITSMADDTDTAPQNQVQQADLQNKIGTFLKTLPEKSRELMLLRYVEDLSVKEIAHITGRSLSDVKVNLHRARIKFDQGFTQHMYAKVAASRDNCDELTRMLAPYTDEVPATQLPIVEKHLQTCRVCANDAEEMKRARKLFAALPLVGAPLALDTSLSKAMAAEVGSAAASSAATGGTATTSAAATAGKAIGTKVAAGVVIASLGGAGIYLATKDNIDVSPPPESVATAQQAAQPGSTVKVDINTVARLTQDGESVTDGVNWTVHRLNPTTADTQPMEWVTSSSNAKPRFQLAPGNYLISAHYGEARQQQQVVVSEDQPLKLDFVLGAGFLNTTARLRPDSPPLTRDVHYQVYEAVPDKDGDYGFVTSFGSQEESTKLPAGRYRVTASMGSNTKVTKEVEIVAGKRQDLDLTLESGFLRLGARLTADGALLEQGVTFGIYEAEPDREGKYKFVTNTDSNQGPVSLPAGNYRVVTTYGANSTHVIDDLLITAGKLTVRDNIVLGSGFLQLGARLTADGPLLDRDVTFKIYTADADAQGKHKLITVTYANREPIKLGSGRYRVVASYGTNSTQVIDDLVIEAGKRTAREDIVFGTGFLQLGARLTADGPLLDKDVTFKIYTADADVQGKHKLITVTYANREPVKLGSGRYRIVTSYGTNAAQVTENVVVEGGKRTVRRDIVLDAGTLQLGARLMPGGSTMKNEVTFKIYDAKPDVSGKYELVTMTYAARKPVKLRAGRYRVVASHGVNVTASREVTVTAGKLTTNDDIILDAGEVKLSARSGNGQANLTDVRFDIFEAQADVSGKRKMLKRVRANSKPVKLAAGTYYVEAKQNDKQTAKTFSVQAGKTANVDLLIN